MTMREIYCSADQVADAILALINSRLQTPRREEIAAIFAKVLPSAEWNAQAPGGVGRALGRGRGGGRYLPARTGEVDVLNDPGGQGWELIAIMTNHVAYLRRQVDNPADAPAERPTLRRRQGVG